MLSSVSKMSSDELVKAVKCLDISVDVGKFLNEEGITEPQVALRIKNDTEVDLVVIIDPTSPVAVALFNSDLTIDIQNGILKALESRT